MELENLKLTVNEGKKIPSIKQQQIELGFFSERQDQIINLKAEGCNTKHNLTEEGEVYEFDTPMFVTDIQTDGNSDGLKIKYQTLCLGSNTFADEFDIDEDDDSATSICMVNKFITAFKIQSNGAGRFFKNQKVQRVLVNVLSPADLQGLVSTYNQLTNLKSKFDYDLEAQIKTHETAKTDFASKVAAHTAAVTEHKQKIITDNFEHEQHMATAIENAKAIDEKVKQLTAMLEAAETELATKQESLDDTNDELNSRNTELKKVNNHLSDLTLRIDERESEYQIKTQNTARLTEKLRTLESDASLFADDIPNFTRQGDSQIKKYLILLSAVLVLAAGLVVVSIHSAYQAYADYVLKPELGVENLLAFKGLLVALVFFAGKFLYQFAKPFIIAILTIDNKKLSLSQITILAREFTDAATEGFDLTQEERLRLRMASRHQHIKEYLGGAYSHNQPQYVTEVKRQSIDVTHTIPLLTKNTHTTKNVTTDEQK